VAFFHVPFVVNLVSMRFDPWITADAVEQSHDVYHDENKVRHAPHRMSLVHRTDHEPKISDTEESKDEKTYRERPRRTYLKKWPFSFLIARAEEAGVVPDPLEPRRIRPNSLRINNRKLDFLLLRSIFEQAFFIFVFH
jgi:hypothetical protein